MKKRKKKKCQRNLSEVSQFPSIHNVSPSKLVNTLPLLAHLPSGHFPEPSASYTIKLLHAGGLSRSHPPISLPLHFLSALIGPIIIKAKMPKEIFKKHKNDYN